MEFTLLGAVAVAVALTYAVLRYEGGRTNAADCTRDVWDGLVSAAVIGLIVGRLVAMIQAGTNPISHPADILIVRAGVDTVAASMAAVVTYLVMTRQDVWWLADAAAPAAVAGLAGWHGGCLVREACLGTSSDLPWAIAQGGSAVTRHPVEIYAALALLVAAIGFLWWKRHRPQPGVIAAAAVATVAGVRLLTEPMRPGLGGDQSWWYASGLAVAVVVIVWRVVAGGSSDGGPAGTA
jgi:prolipoprotein diacylglyceryltransferase